MRILLLVVAALTFGAASLTHSGLVTPIDPLPVASIAEALIAAVLAAGVAAAALRRPAARWLVPATTLFAILGTLLGLSVVASGHRTGDVAYHVAALVVLAASLALTLRAEASRRRPGASPG
jgi:peptidoglycan/LPS O-acetylase OafA/YrhL